MRREVVQVTGGYERLGYRILVVEDTADSRGLVKFVLQAEGYHVSEAENGVAAVEVAQRERPDLILMDMSLPFIDGCEATRRIRKLPGSRTTPIIAFTAYNQWDWRSKAILAGCTNFLTKPIHTKLLLEMLSGYLPGTPPS